MGGVGSLVTTQRNLDLHKLEALAERIGAQRHLWRASARHEPERRVYTQLHRDPHVDVWLICWDASQETGLHDHDRSSGAVHVVDGTCSKTRSSRATTGLACRRWSTGQVLASASTRLSSTTCATTVACRPRRSMSTRPRSGAWGTTSSAHAGLGVLVTYMEEVAA